MTETNETTAAEDDRESAEIPEECVRAALMALRMSPDIAVNDLGAARRMDVIGVARAFASMARERTAWHGIRVLRVMEYVYPDLKTMQTDMSRWNLQGTMPVVDGTTIRSTVLPLEVLD